MFEAMYEGKIDGLCIMGSNPVVGGPNANRNRPPFNKWLVV